MYLFEAALLFNGYLPTFDGTFTAADSAVVKKFQQFEAFTTAEQTGIGDYTTWAELIVSTGDPNRTGTGADMASTITADRAKALVAAGYKTVGRSLTNEQVADPLDKNIKPGELDTIFNAGLRLFPIFEEGGYKENWFTSDQGYKDAARAYEAARGYGIPAGTTIYFAVDVDVTEAEVTADIIPYFAAINNHMTAAGGTFGVGIYGSRNTCTLVADSGLSTASFVAGLSTGFSGNLGYPIPRDWAFNQIQTLTIGSGTGSVEIDKNVVSGRDNGISATSTPASQPLYAWLDTLQGLAQKWVDSGKGSLDLPANTLVLQYIRFPTYGAGDSVGGNTGSITSALEWDVVAGACDVDWIDYATDQGAGRIEYFVEPSSWAVNMGTEHLAASTDAMRKWGIDTSLMPNVGDGGTWAGDLYTIVGSWQKTVGGSGNPYNWAFERIGTSNSASFSTEDFFQDIDALNLSDRIRYATSDTTAGLFRDYYENDASGRFNAALKLRFGGTTSMLTTVVTAAMSATLDSATNVFRDALITKSGGDYRALSDSQKTAFAQAFIDRFEDYRSQE